MNCNATIPVFDLLSATLHTRQAATELLQVIAQNHCNLVELDFANVEYISRSFADQFHTDKLQLAASTEKTIVVTNANEEVIKMLQAVAKTQNKADRSYEKIPVYNYTDWNSLERFLLSV